MWTAKTDQTGWMPRLIWVFAGHTNHFVGFVMRQLICEMLKQHDTNHVHSCITGDNTHQIPVENFELADSNYRGLWIQIENFINPQGEKPNHPPLYCLVHKNILNFFRHLAIVSHCGVEPHFVCKKKASSTEAAPVAEWLRMLIFSALNRSSSHRCWFEPGSGHM